MALIDSIKLKAVINGLNLWRESQLPSEQDTWTFTPKKFSTTFGSSNQTRVPSGACARTSKHLMWSLHFKSCISNVSQEPRLFSSKIRVSNVSQESCLFSSEGRVSNISIKSRVSTTIESRIPNSTEVRIFTWSVWQPRLWGLCSLTYEEYVPASTKSMHIGVKPVKSIQTLYINLQSYFTWLLLRGHSRHGESILWDLSAPYQQKVIGSS